MTRRVLTIALAFAVALAMASFAMAQAKPDFSGKWTQDMDKSDPAPAGRAGGGGGGGGRGPAGPQEITITQSATELTIERTMGQNTMKTIYKLDGSESVNTMGRGEIKSKTTWEGNKLVTKYQQTRGENTVDVTETRSIEADGTLKLVTQSGQNTRAIVFKKG